MRGLYSELNSIKSVQFHAFKDMELNIELTSLAYLPNHAFGHSFQSYIH